LSLQASGFLYALTQYGGCFPLTAESLDQYFHGHVDVVIFGPLAGRGQVHFMFVRILKMV